MNTFYETSWPKSCAMKVNGILFHIVFWALDQAQPGKHPFFSFTTFTFHFVHSNNNDWRKN